MVWTLTVVVSAMPKQSTPGRPACQSRSLTDRRAVVARTREPGVEHQPGWVAHSCRSSSYKTTRSRAVTVVPRRPARSGISQECPIRTPPLGVRLRPDAVQRRQPCCRRTCRASSCAASSSGRDSRSGTSPNQPSATQQAQSTKSQPQRKIHPFAASRAVWASRSGASWPATTRRAAGPTGSSTGRSTRTPSFMS